MTLTSFYLKPAMGETDNVLHPSSPEPEALSPAHYSSVQVRLQLQGKARAEGRRLKKFPKKEEVPFPTRAAYDQKTGDQIYLHDLVDHWLVSRGLRMMNDHGGLLPLQTLSDAFYELIWEHGSHLVHIDSYEPIWGRSKASVLLATKLEELCDNAAQGALNLWDANFMKTLSARGRKGGLVGKPRGRKKSLDELAELDHLTREEAAKVLAVSPRTIQRMRQDLKALRGETDKPTSAEPEQLEEETDKPTVYFALPEQALEEAPKQRSVGEAWTSADMDPILGVKSSSASRHPATPRYTTDT